jgi:hypothetical protein
MEIWCDGMAWHWPLRSQLFWFLVLYVYSWTCLFSPQLLLFYWEKNPLRLRSFVSLGVRFHVFYNPKDNFSQLSSMETDGNEKNSHATVIFLKEKEMWMRTQQITLAEAVPNKFCTHTLECKRSGPQNELLFSRLKKYFIMEQPTT